MQKEMGPTIGVAVRYTGRECFQEDLLSSCAVGYSATFTPDGAVKNTWWWA